MNWADKNVLITGISGFVGSYLGRELIKGGLMFMVSSGDGLMGPYLKI